MEEYIERCLNSLIIPNLNDIEVLVINDGSKDRTSEIAHSYQNKHPSSFRVIDKENGHYGSCINRGIKEATGKYVKILDADDYFDTQNFISFVDWLKESDADLVISSYIIKDEKRNKTNLKVLSGYDGNFLMHILDKVLSDNITNNIQMHGYAYKTSIFSQINYIQTEGYAYTDQEWISFPMIKVKTIGYFNKPVYVYLLGRENQSVNFQNRIPALTTILELIPKRIGHFNNYKDKIETVQKHYLEQRLINSIIGIYKTYLKLIDYEGVNSKLIEFDQIILTHFPHRYHYFDRIKFNHLNFRIVKYWRGHNHSTPFIFNLLNKLSRYVFRNL